MDTELQSPQRNYPAYDPYQIQCLRCGKYYPKQKVSYENLRTGEHKSAIGLSGCLTGCLFWIIGYIAIGLLADFLIVLPILYFTGNLSNPLYGDTGFVAIPFGIIGASVAVALYLTRRQDRLNKTHRKIEHFKCTQCKAEWDFVQEPPVKKLP